MIAQTDPPEPNKMSQNRSRTSAGRRARKALSMPVCWAALASTLLLAAPTDPIISNPSIVNPIGPPTVPPSSFQSGPVTTPSPTGANQVVTGSLGGGQRLGTPVPYRSPAGFAPRPGSSSLDSFLTYSAGTADTGTLARQYAGGLTSLYQPGSAVTTTPGRTTIFSAQTPKVIGPVTSPSLQTHRLPLLTGPTEQAGGQADLYRFSTTAGRPETSVPSSSYWQSVGSLPIPGASTEAQKQKPTSTQLPGLEDAGLLTGQQTSGQQAILDNIEQYRREMRELQQRIEQLNDRVAQLTEGLGASQTSPRQPPDTTPRPEVTPGAFDPAPLPDTSSLGVLQPPGLPTHLAAPDGSMSRAPSHTIPSATTTTPTIGLTLYDPRRMMLDDITAASPSSDTATDNASEPLEPLPAIDAILRAARSPDAAQREATREPADDLRELIRKWDIQAEAIAGRQPGQARADNERRRGLRIWRSPRETADQKDQTTPPKGLSETGAKALTHKTFESFSKDKFTTHMASADDYMQQGRYYRAAEAYTLAALYKPRDVRPQLGKGHALFAAGEYLSSAIYIAKALEAAPPGTLTHPADLVRAVGGPSPFEARLTDLARCAQASEAPELKFLLAYVYLRTGDAARAKAALTLTAEHFRAWPAARILRQAIHEATLAPYLK